jgi:NOL1/NOP2/fmu family ribosome biogenesis protein
MFRKSDDALEMWSESTVLGCAKRQASLMTDAANLVKPGGVLVYSTCTFAPEENEFIIAKFLKDHADFELEPIPLPNVSPGRPDWLPDDLCNTELSKTIRLFPHKIKGEGHFVAKLRKTRGEESSYTNATFRPVNKQVEKMWLEFVRSTLSSRPVPDMPLTLFGNKLFAVPENVPMLQGVNTLRTGLWLGTCLKDRFEPSHSLALALAKDELGERLELTPDDEMLKRYRQGYELEHSGEEGWLIITVSGFPLGWGRRSKNIIKNYYPKGLRSH